MHHFHVLTSGCRKAEEVFHGSIVKGLHVFYEDQLPYSSFVGNKKSFLKSILLHPLVVNSTPVSIVLGCVDNGPLQYIAIQRSVLIFYGVVRMLITVSTTVFFPVYPSLVAIRFSASVQLLCSLSSSHNGGSPEEIAQEAERSRRDRTRRVEQARPADPTNMALLQAAAGTVDSKEE